MLLEDACKQAVESGHAKAVYGSAIEVIGSANPEKLHQLEEDYGKAIECAFQERDKQKNAALRKLLREGPWYF